ncbi:MAG: HAMP domain-containing histidine kinase [Lachnospiraceae bacterium]|nr:HAMP domain-containing histidine kinase [Lachnospiraceae bacterium]
MRLWQRIYIIALLLFLPVLNVGLFMGARMIFNYNMDVTKGQASDEVHLLSRTIVKDIESLDYKQQMDDYIVYRVAEPYVNYITNKDANATLEVHYVGEKTTLQMGQQDISIYDTGDYPEIRVLELLEAPYENYQLFYFKPLDDFYKLWQSLKLVFGIISLCCSGVLAVVLYLLLYEMTVPLQRLTQSVKLMQKGEPWQAVEVEGHDDIADLTKSFNEMGAEIEAQMEQLYRESKTKQQLVDDLAHEMRTPLTAIYGYAEYLQKAPYTEEEKLDALDYIMSESKRLSHMGQELLTMAIFREDEVNVEQIDSVSLAKDISSLLQGSLREKRLKLIKSIKPVSFEGDRAMIVCLLRNLIENAARASDSGARIWLTIDKSDEKTIYMRIKDEGIGMEAHDLERITDAFYRVDKARSRSNGGAGIGLNLCDLIVKKHSGTMQFESVPKQGTTVTVLLPVQIERNEE